VFIIEDYTCINGALCWDCNIIIYLQCKIVGWENRLTVHHGGSWVPSPQIFVPRSRLANRIHNTWKDTPEQIGNALWLVLSFPFLWQSSLSLLPTLQLHVWLETKWHYFQVASVLFRFELQQVISKWSRQLCVCKYLIRVMYLCHPLWQMWVYIKYVLKFNEPMITLWNGIDLLWVEETCAVLFSDKCPVSLVERTSTQQCIPLHHKMVMKEWLVTFWQYVDFW